jgi:hypothetical protein
MALKFGCIKWQRGQAAITDALFFLIIVMSVATFLFLFSTNFGLGLGKIVTERFALDYATSALKTLQYESTPRLIHIDQSLDDAKEVDYLMAMIKEDYASDEEIGSFKNVLIERIVEVMKPIESSFDYLFLISVESSGEGITNFPFVFMQVTRFTVEEQPSNARLLKVTGSQKEKFFCAPSSKHAIDNFLLRVGVRGRAFTPITFPKIVEQNGIFFVDVDRGEIELFLWSPSLIFTKKDSDVINPAEFDDENLNCSPFISGEEA